MGKRTRTIRSNGEPSASGYVRMQVPAHPPEPPLPEERVVITDPRIVAMPAGSPSGSGPRNPDQAVFPAPTLPAIDLPDGRPITKAQRFLIDPELLARWEDEEERRNKAV
jgi:hypothetical protein